MKTIPTPSLRHTGTELTRRDFIVQSTSAGGALVLGWQVPLPAAAQPAPAAAAAGTELNLWVVVKPDDSCVVRIARSEMGQGTLTGLAQLVAEELECDWTKVSTEQISPQRNFAAQRGWGEMGTGGSRGIRTSQDYVRRGGAAARMMLLQAAADDWKLPVAELQVANGVITHAASGRRATYGQLATAAARQTPPDLKAIVLKDPRTWKVAGTSRKRLDTADKLDGSKIYAIDVRLPGQLSAAIKACPVWGGKLVSMFAGGAHWPLALETRHRAFIRNRLGGFGECLAEFLEHLAHLVARHPVAALVGNFPAVLQYLDGLGLALRFQQARSQQLVDLRKLRAQFQCPAEGGNRFGVLAGFHVELAEPEVAEFVIRIVRRHFVKLGDPFLKLTHDVP